MTRARRFGFTLALAAALVTVPAIADAPQDQYEPFDRDTAAIKDAFTHLEWERRPLSTPIGYVSATTRCESGTVFANGRLPTVKELLTILDEEPHSEYESGAIVAKMIDALAFPDTPVSKPYLSTTPVDATHVWGLDFKDGKMVALDKTDLSAGLVRCVR
jgi:hypothetical protein